MFARITNWNGCIPEEFKEQQGGEGEGFMSIYPFEKVVWPKRVGSPFLAGRGGGVKGVKGPGGIVNVSTVSGVDQASGGGDGDNARKKLRSDGNPGRGQQQQQQQQPTPSVTNITGSGVASSGAVQAFQMQNQYQPYPQAYMQQQPVVNQGQIQRPLGPDRSIITAAGGLAAIGGASQVEKLPPETSKDYSLN